MKEWKCNTIKMARFTIGKIYTTDEEGHLIDDDYASRLQPSNYNKVFPNSFIELIKIDCTNK